ncbi:MAG TPA: hypothetical protein VN446_00335 [Candidatus Acidoferrum sp.]|nr:hypothetical protein [Candidatus Acidoferrum sp.]
MRNYVNKFIISINPADGEMVIDFFQSAPSVMEFNPEPSNVPKMVPVFENLGGMIITIDKAKKLADVIQQLLEQQSQEEATHKQ